MTRVALVTGGASGIGAEVGRLLAARGDRVVLVDIDAERGRAVADEIGADFLHGDVSNYEHVVATTAAAEELRGGLDAVVLNAGIGTGCGLGDDFDPAAYRRAMGVNLDAVVFGAHAALPALRRRGGGAIVATASMAGLTATAFDPVYGANKHAVVGLCRALGEAWAPYGVRVNAFCPAFTDTAILGPLRESLTAMRVPVMPVQVAGEAVLTILDSELTGQAWLLQAGRDVEPYRFRGLPAPLDDAGERAGAMDPTAAGPL